MASRPHRSRTRQLRRRRRRQVLVGLTSLALVVTGTSSIATPEQPDAAEVLEEVAQSEPTLDVEVAPEDAATTAPEAPEAEEQDSAPAQEESSPQAEEDPVTEATEELADTETEEPAGGADDAPAQEPDEAAAADVGTLDVPPGDPGEDEAKLIVSAGGDRTGTGPTSSEATPLAGVTFEFFRVSVTTPPGVSVGSCTTDETGECGVFVDLPGEFMGNDAFYARQTAAPEGWTAPQLWDPDGQYVFLTEPISAEDSTAERIIELPLAFNDTVTEPTWASVRPNNVAPPQCGLDMALVVDLSNSITQEDLLDDYKAAANGFIDALTGTPSQVALYSFASAAPAQGPTNGGLPLTSVATPEGAALLQAQINGFAQTPSGGGGTNWDRAFHQVAESGEEFDVVLFLTDGQPTFHRDRQGPGDVATIEEVNEAILSANAVKATGAQVILVGIGPEAFLPGASIRIPLVAGPDEGEDFYRTEFEQLGETLEQIATEDCAGTLTVVKELQDADGEVAPAGAGWTFSTDTADVTPQTGTTDETSAVNFEVDHGPGNLTRPVTITETQQEGYELVQVDGDNAVCVDAATGAGLPVTNDGPLGFTVDVAAQAVVSCTVRNAELPPDYADLEVSKTAATSFVRDWDWDIAKVAEEDYLEVPAGEDGTFSYDVTVTPEGPTESSFLVTGQITVSNPNDVDVTGVSVDDGFAPGVSGTCEVTGGDDVTVGAGESVVLAYSCTVTDGTATLAGTNEVEVTWDAAAFPGTSGSAVATAPFDFAQASVAETDRYVTVTDSEFDLSTLPGGNALDAVDGEQVLSYDLTWPSTPGQCEVFENTATVVNSPEPLIGPLVVNESSSETVTLCAGVDLDVEKNVVLNYDRTYLWEIDKEADETVLTVDPETGTATFDYTVTATPTGSSDANWAMQGVITVTNPNDWLDITADVTDTVDVGGGAVCVVTDGDDVVVPAGGSVELDYTCTFVFQPSYSGTNTATVTWDEDAPTPSSSAVGTVDIEPGGWSQTPINSSVQVYDDQTDPANPVHLGTAVWNADGEPTEFTYSLDLEGVPGTCVEYTNTAWIQQTEQQAQETVTVCAEAPLTVTETAEASYDRLYLWDVEKDVDETDVVVDENGQATYSYTVDALPGAFTDSGWELGGEITVTNPNDFTPVTVTVTDTVDVGGGAVCTVADGEDVEIPASGSVTLDYSCTFTGEPDGEGENTATVTWTDSAGVERSAEASADVEFVLDEETDETVEVVDDQTDPENPVTLGIATWNAEGTPVSFTYDLVHQGVGGACMEFTNTAWVVVTGDDPSDSETVELCIESQLEHEKTAVSANQQADGSWQVRYEIDVTNPAAYPGVYSLSDTIEYGEGITPTEAIWFPADDPTAGGAWTGLPDERTAVLATDAEIAADTTHTYVVVVTAEVAAGIVGTDAGQCEDDELEEGGGFLNAARLTAFGQNETDRACEEPVAPTVDKTAGDLTDNEDGTWTVTYTVDVANPDSARTVTYDLADELQFAGGVEVITATIERDGTVSPDWDGITETVVATGVELAPETTHTYTVTVVVDLTEVTVPDDAGVRECADDDGTEGEGLLNTVVITSGNDDYDDDACVPVPNPDMSVDKTAVSANRTGQDRWEVTYRVVASNDSTVGGVYDLTDTIEFGEGITPLSASWELEGTDDAGEWSDLPDEPTATLADGRALAGGESHTYVVTVVAEVAVGVVDGEVGEGQCTGDDGTEGGGFLNSATLVAHGDDSTDRDCLPPTGEPAWTLTKSSDPESGSRVRPGDTIVYTVTATPTGDETAVDLLVEDDLSDVLDHAAATGTPQASTGSVSWDGDVLVWEIPELDEAATLTYRVVVDDDAWNVTLRNVVTGEGPPPPVCVGDCTTTHTTPPKPGLPPTGAAVAGIALIAVLLAGGGLALVTTRRRREM